MKLLNSFLAILFILFAIVQYNDPDPWAWIALYLFVAVVCGFAFFSRYHRYIIIAGLAVCIIWLATLVPDFIRWVKMGMPTITGSMKAEAPHIELTREFLGLAVCMAALGFQYFQAKKKGDIGTLGN